MRIRKAVDFDKVKQQEIVAEFTLNKKQTNEIVKNFFNFMDYYFFYSCTLFYI